MSIRFVIGGSKTKKAVGRTRRPQSEHRTFYVDVLPRRRVERPVMYPPKRSTERSLPVIHGFTAMPRSLAWGHARRKPRVTAPTGAAVGITAGRSMS